MTYLARVPDYAALAQDYAWERSTKREDARRERSEPLLYKLDRATRWRLHVLPRVDMSHLVQRHVDRGAVLASVAATADPC